MVRDWRHNPTLCYALEEIRLFQEHLCKSYMSCHIVILSVTVSQSVSQSHSQSQSQSVSKKHIYNVPVINFNLLRKMLMQILQSTTLTCFVDDPKWTEALGEFLLQVNNGLLQGSTQTGLNAPKGSIFLSTNLSECTCIYFLFCYFSLTK